MSTHLRLRVQWVSVEDLQCDVHTSSAAIFVIDLGVESQVLCGHVHLCRVQLFIDCVSIGTFSRVLKVLFPRLSIFGVSGVHRTSVIT